MILKNIGKMKAKEQIQYKTTMPYGEGLSLYVRTKWYKRLWNLLTNPILYLLVGKLRW